MGGGPEAAGRGRGVPWAEARRRRGGVRLAELAQPLRPSGSETRRPASLPCIAAALPAQHRPWPAPLPAHAQGAPEAEEGLGRQRHAVEAQHHVQILPRAPAHQHAPQAAALAVHACRRQRARGRGGERASSGWGRRGADAGAAGTVRCGVRLRSRGCKPPGAQPREPSPPRARCSAAQARARGRSRRTRGRGVEALAAVGVGRKVLRVAHRGVEAAAHLRQPGAGEGRGQCSVSVAGSLAGPALLAGEPQASSSRQQPGQRSLHEA